MGSCRAVADPLLIIKSSSIFLPDTPYKTKQKALGLFSAPKENNNSGQNHGNTQELPHGQHADKTNLGVWLTKELNHNPEAPVAKQEKAEHGAGGVGTILGPPEDHEQQHPLQEELIELGGVSGVGTAARKDHGPGQVAFPAKEFGVDEIANPTQAQADGNGHHIDVRRLPEIEFSGLTKQKTTQDNPDQGPMKRHPPLPGSDDFGRVVKVIGKIVKQDIAEPATQNQTEH